MLIRSFSSSDVSAYVDLINSADEVDKLGKATSAQHVREWLGQPNRYPERDLFLAELAGTLVGYVEVCRELEIGRVILEGAVHPAHRGRGIGAGLLEAALSHSQELGARLVHIPIPERMAAARRLAEGRGLAIVRRHWQMQLGSQAEIPQMNLPPGFGCRHFLAGDEDRLTALQNLAFAQSWGFRPNSVAEIGYRVGMSSCCDEGILFISEGDKAVAYCWTRRDECIGSRQGTGHIWMMGVDPQYQGYGLGRAALLAGIDSLRRRGLKTIELAVDSQNLAARQLYESVGFERKGVILWYQRALTTSGC